MLTVHGINGDIDAGTETVVPAGGVWVPPTAARVHAIVSSSANDAAAGSGARTVRLIGVPAGGGIATETVALNGTTPVNSSGSYIHIISIQVLTVGAGGVNAGLITATAATDSTVSCSIEVGHNQSSGAVLYAAGTGLQYTISGVHVGMSVLGSATVSHQAFLVVGRVGAPARRIPLTGSYSGATTALTVPVHVDLQSGDWARVDVTSSAANTVVIAGIHYTVN